MLSYKDNFNKVEKLCKKYGLVRIDRGSECKFFIPGNDNIYAEVIRLFNDDSYYNKNRVVFFNGIIKMPEPLDGCDYIYSFNIEKSPKGFYNNIVDFPLNKKKLDGLEKIIQDCLVQYKNCVLAQKLEKIKHVFD